MWYIYTVEYSWLLNNVEVRGADTPMQSIICITFDSPETLFILCICRGLIPGCHSHTYTPWWIPKSEDSQVPYIKWCKSKHTEGILIEKKLHIQVDTCSLNPCCSSARCSIQVKKKWSTDKCYNMDETQKHNSKSSQAKISLILLFHLYEMSRQSNP